MPTAVSAMCGSSIARRHRASSIRSRPSQSRPRRAARIVMVDAMSSFGAIPVDMERLGHRRHGVVLQQVHRGRAGLLLCACAGATCSRRAKAIAIPSCSISMSSGRCSRRPASSASRRRPMRSSPSSRRSRSMRTQGGVAARGARYRRNADVLVKGMRDMGFETLLADDGSRPDHPDLPHAARSQFRFRDASTRCCAQRGYRHLSGQAHQAAELPHRHDRPDRRNGDARRAQRDPRGAARHECHRHAARSRLETRDSGNEPSP